jgi:cyclophilin family peptidyl-prolyl cis-trans isomerase
VSEIILGINFGTYQPLYNMIWDRCVPGFTLQGGDYDTTDRTNGNPVEQITSVYSEFTESEFLRPAFASQVDNEFNVGPVIHNTFGTLAMAKIAGYPDSAANAFFFNLADNSTNLDYENGGYTVFGRVISGSNVLQYFNTLSKPDKGIFDSTTVSTNQTLTSVPVNYDGLRGPANSNLFFGDFTLLSTVNADTNPPTVAVNSPTNSQTLTNADVVVQGTANDNVGVANVAC